MKSKVFIRVVVTLIVVGSIYLFALLYSNFFMEDDDLKISFQLGLPIIYLIVNRKRIFGPIEDE